MVDYVSSGVRRGQVTFWGWGLGCEEEGTGGVGGSRHCLTEASEHSKSSTCQSSANLKLKVFKFIIEICFFMNMLPCQGFSLRRDGKGVCGSGVGRGESSGVKR